MTDIIPQTPPVDSSSVRRTRRHQLYRHFDADGVLLYVGISVSALARLSGHRASADWYDRVATVTIENHPSRAAVMRAEAEAIRAESPLFNKLHNAGRVDIRPPLAPAYHDLSTVPATKDSAAVAEYARKARENERMAHAAMWDHAVWMSAAQGDEGAIR